MRHAKRERTSNEVVRTASSSAQVERAAMHTSVAESAVMGGGADHRADFQQRREALRLALAALDD